ncbi:MAG: hypothetical protein ACP5J9_00515 [Dictyoglomus sp.]
MKKRFLPLLILAIFLMSISYAATTTFRYKDLLYDPRAMGMAGVMTALADSPTSAIYNPALMGEYSRLAFKFGFGIAPLDEQNFNNLNTFVKYLQLLQNNSEPPDGKLSLNLSSAGYLHLGISKLGLTLFGDGDVDAYYYKYTASDLYADLQLEGQVSLDANVKANGALTVAIPAIDLLGLKVNFGANVRAVNEYHVDTSISTKATETGVAKATLTGGPNENDYYKRKFDLIEQRYVSFDLGTYVRFSPFVAAGIVVKDVYAIPLEGKETSGYEEGYYYLDSAGNPTYSTVTPYSETSTPIDVVLPDMSLKAGVFVKVPVLGTRVSVDADLDKTFTPLSYRFGIEQPLFFVLTARGGAVLNTNFQPQLYTLGLGLNVLLIQADAAIAIDPQVMAPVAGSISGSIRF